MAGCDKDCLKSRYLAATLAKIDLLFIRKFKLSLTVCSGSKLF